MKNVLLLVENINNKDTSIIENLKKFLPDSNILTTQCDDTGINLAKAYLPDIILVNIVMPDEDGHKFCKQVKNDKDLKNIPVILINEKNDDNNINKVQASAADAIITKPFYPYELYMHVKNILRFKKAEDNLKIAIKKAGESERLKKAFLNTISHELRTPLNAIIGFSDIIFNHDLSEDELKDYAESILTSGYNLLEIIDNIIDIALIEANEIKITKNKISIKNTLEDIYNAHKNNNKVITDQVKLFLNKKLFENEHIVYTDEIYFCKIINNLIKNAFKFTENGKIEFGYSYNNNDDQNSFYQFFVTDTGIGIPKDKQLLIFNHFCQADSSLSRKYVGIGLTLSISQKLVKLLGGNMWVESENGSGSTFFFTMPCNIKETKQRYKKVIA